MPRRRVASALALVTRRGRRLHRRRSDDLARPTPPGATDAPSTTVARRRRTAADHRRRAHNHRAAADDGGAARRCRLDRAAGLGAGGRPRRRAAAPSSSCVEPPDGDVVADGRGRRTRLAPVPQRRSGLVRDRAARRETTEPFTVAALDDIPPASFYAEQRLPAGGFGYLETRDGTTLSVNVVLPGPAADGARTRPSSSTPATHRAIPTPRASRSCSPPSATPTSGSTCAAAGAAAGRSASSRTPSCSTATTPSRRSPPSRGCADTGSAWSAISYPGISQLFVASTQPPSLAAITPLSVIDDSYSGVLYPGGLLNTGFGVEWTQERMDETAPRGSGVGRRPDRRRRRGVRGEPAPAPAEPRPRRRDPTPTRSTPPTLGDPLAPRTFVDQIDVPVFLAGAWQDEQTGGRSPRCSTGSPGTDHFYASLVNGLHTESIGSTASSPATSSSSTSTSPSGCRRWTRPGRSRPSSPAAIFGTDQVTLPPDRFTGQTYEQALATFEAEPPIQVLFEEGAPTARVPGTPQPALDRVVRLVAGARRRATSWYLGPRQPGDRTAGRASPARRPTPPTPTPSRRRSSTTASGSVWAYDVTWDWQQPPAGTAASFVSAPLTADTVVVGSGSADLWIRIGRRGHRPRGDDQRDPPRRPGGLRPERLAAGEPAGARRAGEHRAAAGPHAPRGRRRAAVAGEWTPVRVELFPVAHAFRAGSRLRVTVDAPGGNRAEWIFDTIAAGETVEIAHGGDQPSRIVLPVVDGHRRAADGTRRARCAASPAAGRRSDPVAAAPSSATACARLDRMGARRPRRAELAEFLRAHREALVARDGQAAPWPRPPHARAAPRGGRPARRRVGDLVHVARTGPPDQRLDRRAAGDRAGAAPRRRRPGPPRLARPPDQSPTGPTIAPPDEVPTRAAPAHRRVRAGAGLRARAALGVRRVERRRGPAVPADRAARGAAAQPDLVAVRRPGRPRPDRRLGHPRPPGAGRVPGGHDLRAPRPRDGGARRRSSAPPARSSAAGGPSTTWPGSRPGCAASTIPAPAC